MYWRHFNLTGEPFSLTPDPAFLYLSPIHAEAFAGLMMGLRERRGLVTMIGEVGTGKTTLVYSLLSNLGPEVNTAYISNARLSFDGIVRSALRDFGVESDSVHGVDLLKTFNEFLQECARKNTTAALVIDEAQNLTHETFEDLRLLSNFETYKHKLLQIVLVGQPELDTKLRDPALRQVTERIAVRCNVNPLTPSEARQYIEHRLASVGGSPDRIFSDSALRLLIKSSRGIPRSINILCHNAMLFAYGRGKTSVSKSLAAEAIAEKQGKGLVRLRAGRWTGVSGGRGFGGTFARAAGIVAVALTAGALGVYLGRAPMRAANSPSQPILPILPSLAVQTAPAPPSPAATHTEVVAAPPDGVPSTRDAGTLRGLVTSPSVNSAQADVSRNVPPTHAPEPIASAQPTAISPATLTATQVPTPVPDSATVQLERAPVAEGATASSEPELQSGDVPAAATIIAPAGAAAAAAAATVSAPVITAPSVSSESREATPPTVVAATTPPVAAVVATTAPQRPDLPIAASEPIAAAAPAETEGTELRVVAPGNSLTDLMLGIYGRYNNKLIRRVQAMNPQVTDPDFIIAGDTLRFPTVPPEGAASAESPANRSTANR